jgi:hypothetical protein
MPDRPKPPIPKEIDAHDDPTRLVLGAIAAAAPARGKPMTRLNRLPHVRIVTYWECAYNTMAQCNASASGRAAQCSPNPYLAYASTPGVRKSKRVRPY